MDRRLLKTDKVINTTPNFKGQYTSYFVVNDYDGEKSFAAHPNFHDEISEVLWLSIDQISNLPNDNCSREFKEVVSKLNRRRNYFGGPLPVMISAPRPMTEDEFENFTRAVVKSYYKRIGPGGSSKKDKTFITNLSNLIRFTSEKIYAENEIEEIMETAACPLVKKKKSSKKIRNNRKSKRNN